MNDLPDVIDSDRNTCYLGWDITRRLAIHLMHTF